MNDPTTTEQPERCPECGSGRVARILYGLPHFSEELERKLEAGEVVLGGCMISDDDPTRQCAECGHRWGERGHRG